MIRYTTPTLPLYLEEVDLSENCDVYVTFYQASSSTEITKSMDDLTVLYDSDENKTTISVTLTQEETATLTAGGKALVQANWIFSNGTRGATEIKKISIKENLLEEVISYGD